MSTYQTSRGRVYSRLILRSTGTQVLTLYNVQQLSPQDDNRNKHRVPAVVAHHHVPGRLFQPDHKLQPLTLE